MSNVFAKLQNARVTLQDMNLKKSGENKFAGYDYYELGDFLPAINKIFAEIGLFGQVSFTSELATLTIINTDKPEEQITFTSPMASANLKGCHDIQNAGAVQTYQRRYLYTTALEIVEHDALDATTGKVEPQKPVKSTQTRDNTQTYQNRSQSNTGQSSAPSNVLSDAQRKMIGRLKTEKQISDDLYRDILKDYGIVSTNDLTKSQASKLIERLTAYVPEPDFAEQEALPF